MASVADESRIVAQTRQKLRSLAAGLQQLASQAASPREFYPRWLAALCEAVAARRATLLRRTDGHWLSFEQHNAASTQADQAFSPELLERCLETGPRVLTPADEHNPTDELLFLLPIAAAGPMPLVAIVVQRPDVSAAAVDGQMRYLLQLLAAAEQFQRGYRGKQADEQNRWLVHLEQFCREAYSADTALTTAAAIANSGLNTTAAERVSVFVGRGREGKLLALSGQQSFDRRSVVVKRLEQLAAAVTRSGLPFFVNVSEDTAEQSLEQDVLTPPPVRRAWTHYDKESHCRAIAILPLIPPEPPSDLPKATKARRGAVVGAMILEWFEEPIAESGWKRRWPLVADHAALALQRYHTRRTGLLAGVLRASGSLARWAVLAAILGGIGFAMATVPYEFAVHSRGTLQPTIRRDVFSPSDGEVADVTVRHAQEVTAGEVLAKLGNDALDYQLQQTQSQLRQVLTNLDTYNKQLHDPRLTPETRSELIARMTAAEEQRGGLEEQQGLLLARKQRLVAKSPIAGEVITWNVAETLLARPVKEGQVLLTVADPAGPWQLEVPLAEDRLGDLLAAKESGSEPIEVSFVLATDPNKTYRGRVEKVAARAELDEEHRNTVLVLVSFEKTDLPKELLRPGSTATVKFHLGERSVGAVIFHDLTQWFQREVLFRIQ